MNLYNHGISPEIVRIITKIATQLDDKYPSEGRLISVDGSFADIRVGQSSALHRHCPVIGDVDALIPGQLVGLRWVSGKPFVLTTSVATEAISRQTFNADGITLENSPYGIRVKPGSLQLSHLSFTPSLEGHTHMDSLTRNGWYVDDDGVISQNNVNISPAGQISLGLSPDILKLDAEHATHRFWIGDVLPANAAFAITKEGAVTATAGEIAGWDILSDRLSKNGAELRASGELILGSGNNIAALSGSNVSGWRLWIGNASPALAPFRVSQSGEVWLDNAHVAMDLQSSNYVSGQVGWKLDSSGWAELQDVSVRGTFEAVTFKNSVTSVLSGRQMVTDGDNFISDVGTTDTIIDLKTNIFLINDILHTQPRPGVQEWFRITDGPTSITGGYRYTVARDLAGDGAQQFYSGENVYRKGTATYPEQAITMGSYEAAMGGYSTIVGGSSFSALGGFLTMEGSRQYGPYFGVATRFGADYNQILDVVRLGRLRGFLDVVSDQYGIAIGDGQRSLVYTYSSGLSIKTNSGLTVIDDDGIASDKLAVVPGSVPDYIDGRGIMYIDQSAKQLRIRYKDGTYESDVLVTSL